MSKKKDFKDFLYRYKVYNNPDADAQEKEMPLGKDAMKKYEGKRNLYDENESRIDKIQSVVRKRKLSKLLSNPKLWKGLT